MLIKISNEREQIEQGKYEMYNLKRKEARGSGMEQNSVFKEINRLKKSWMLNRVKGGVTSGNNPTQISFQFCKKKMKTS